MKTLLVAVLLTLTVANGLALKCTRCIPPRGGGRCRATTETCRSDMDACVTVSYLSWPYAYFQRCIKMSDCRNLQEPPHVTRLHAHCCQTDLCNFSSIV